LQIVEVLVVVVIRSLLEYLHGLLPPFFLQDAVQLHGLFPLFLLLLRLEATELALPETQSLVLLLLPDLLLN